jgi:hypothetical protein
MAIDLGLTTRAKLAAEAGSDFEENVDQLAEEQDYADQAEVDVSGNQSKTSAPPQAEPLATPPDPAEVTREELTTQALAEMRASSDSLARVVEQQARALSTAAHKPAPAPVINVTTPAVNVELEITNEATKPGKTIGRSRRAPDNSLVFETEFVPAGAEDDA